MQTYPSDSPPEAECVLVVDAALLAGRSVSWVRRYRTFGPLVPAEVDGRQAVTAASLYALMRRTQKAPRLRLVVDNT